MNILGHEITKNKRSWKRFCRVNDIDHAPEPKRFPCIVRLLYPGKTVEYCYLSDVEKMRSALIKMGGVEV